MHGSFGDRLVNKVVVGLSLSLLPTVAGAANFDTCMNDAMQAGSVTTDGYVSYHCANATAEKLSARPDECPVGHVRPALKSLVRRQQQLDDGLLTTVAWTAGRCTGSCVMRSFDSQETTYACEVRIYSHDPEPAPPEPPSPQVTEEPSPRPLHRPAPRYPQPAGDDHPHRHRYPDRYADGSPPPDDWRPPPRPRFWSDGPRRPRFWWGPDWDGPRPPPYSPVPRFPERPPWGVDGYYCW